MAKELHILNSNQTNGITWKYSNVIQRRIVYLLIFAVCIGQDLRRTFKTCTQKLCAGNDRIKFAAYDDKQLKL
jgi:hypothetical protein